MEGKELNTHQKKKKGKRKSTGQKSVGVISLAPVAVGWMPLKADKTALWCMSEVLGGNENIFEDESLGEN